MAKYNIQAEYTYGTSEPIEADSPEEAYELFCKDLNDYYIDTISCEVEETNEEEENND